jgi:hypothetical protein
MKYGILECCFSSLSLSLSLSLSPSLAFSSISGVTVAPPNRLPFDYLHSKIPQLQPHTLPLLEYVVEVLSHRSEREVVHVTPHILLGFHALRMVGKE